MSPDIEWADTQLEKVSRTFALSISYLPDTHEQQMTLAYLLCRIPDTIEDTDRLTSEEKITLLTQYNETLLQEKDGVEFRESVEQHISPMDVSDNPDWRLVFEVERLLTILHSRPKDEQEVMNNWVSELTVGMAEFMGRDSDKVGVRIESFTELDEYCYYVAGTVGHMIIDLLDVTYDVSYEDVSKEELHILGREYGLLLQYVNIVKDVYDDYHSEDNIYIPAELVDKYDLSQTEFASTSHTHTDAIISEVIEYADSYFESSNAFLNWLLDNKPSAYKGWAIPHFLAVASMRELQENAGLATSETEVKINREEVLEIVQNIDDFSVEELNSMILQSTGASHHETTA